MPVPNKKSTSRNPMNQSVTLREDKSNLLNKDSTWGHLQKLQSKVTPLSIHNKNKINDLNEETI